MFDSIRSRIAMAVVVVAVGVTLVSFAIAYLEGSSKSASINQDYKRIVIYTPIYRTGEKPAYNFAYAKIQDIQTNSATRFLNPFGKSMSSFSQSAFENNNLTEDERTSIVIEADAFEQYFLIRLPPELGGNLDNVTAFRAYSNLDPGSKCFLGYRSNPENGAVLQDPCHSDIFRVTDGYSCFGKVVSGNPTLHPSFSRHQKIIRLA
jgi:hypothetical protein